MNRETNTTNSSITFGGYDSSLIEGDVNWHQVTDPLFWAIDAE